MRSTSWKIKSGGGGSYTPIYEYWTKILAMKIVFWCKKWINIIISLVLPLELASIQNNTIHIDSMGRPNSVGGWKQIYNVEFTPFALCGGNIPLRKCGYLFSLIRPMPSVG